MAAAAAAGSAPRWWVAWYAPALSLQAWASTLPLAQQARPLALLAQHRVLAVNPAAAALGVQAGMKRATALALAPQLTLGAADAQRDLDSLRTVAHAALAFSPNVCWAPGPAPGVMAELQASLRCFGGPERLWQRMAAAMAPLGLDLLRAHAPTAQGAWLLAQAGAGAGEQVGVGQGGDASDPAGRSADPSAGRSVGSSAGSSAGLRASAHAARSSGVTAGPNPRGVNAGVSLPVTAGPSVRTQSAVPPTSGLADRQRDLPLEPVPASERTGLRDPAVWADLARRLDPLPVTLLVHEPAARATLLATGLRTLADLRRQPRAGLARRLGPGLLQRLDQAYGEAPEPQDWLQAPLCFASSLELAYRSEQHEVLLDAAQTLLARLAAWAGARHARVQRFVLGLQHETRLRASSLGEAGPQRSELTVALAEPSADPTHWRAVLRERLAREPLRAPVLALQLSCDEPVLGPPPDAELFPSAAGQREGLLRLLERLQARLGPDGVQALSIWPDHRPEHATRYQAALNVAKAWPVADPRAALQAREPAAPAPHERPRVIRPAWLLAEPLALAEHQSRPCLQGQPLRLLGGPERIESGWWETALLGPERARADARDYFIAQAPSGELLWVYRLRLPPLGAPVDTPGGWFLHGRFA